LVLTHAAVDVPSFMPVRVYHIYATKADAQLHMTHKWL